MTRMTVPRFVHVARDQTANTSSGEETLRSTCAGEDPRMKSMPFPIPRSALQSHGIITPWVVGGGGDRAVSGWWRALARTWTSAKAVTKCTKTVQSNGFDPVCLPGRRNEPIRDEVEHPIAAQRSNRSAIGFQELVSTSTIQKRPSSRHPHLPNSATITTTHTASATLRTSIRHLGTHQISCISRISPSPALPSFSRYRPSYPWNHHRNLTSISPSTSAHKTNI